MESCLRFLSPIRVAQPAQAIRSSDVAKLFSIKLTFKFFTMPVVSFTLHQKLASKTAQGIGRD